MKKILVSILLIAVLALVPMGAYAIDVETSHGQIPTDGQVTCGATAQVLWPATLSTASSPQGRLSITFQRIDSGSNVVCISPNPSLTTATAGICLFSQGQSVTIDRVGGTVTYYCLTSDSTAIVGVLEQQ